MKKNEQDIVELITKLQEQVTSLERKVDTLINRSLPKPAESSLAPQSFPKPYPQPASTLAQAVARQDSRVQAQSAGRQDVRFESPNRQDNRFQNGGGSRPDNRFGNNGSGRHDNRFGERVMHKAICAECKKACEVPFKPVEGRPIYCQGCFSRRKAGSSYKPSFNDRPPREVTPVQASSPQPLKNRLQASPQASEKKNIVAKKKPASGKKPVTKKKRK